jgi:hypothetical protein
MNVALSSKMIYFVELGRAQDSQEICCIQHVAIVLDDSRVSALVSKKALGRRTNKTMHYVSLAQKKSRKIIAILSSDAWEVNLS